MYAFRELYHMLGVQRTWCVCVFYVKRTLCIFNLILAINVNQMECIFRVVIYL